MCIGTEAEVPGVGAGGHDRAVVASAALETVIRKGGPAAIFRKNFVLKQRARAILEREPAPHRDGGFTAGEANAPEPRHGSVRTDRALGKRSFFRED